MRYSEIHRRTCVTLATVALLPLTAVAAAAQIANQSDISGISITSSSIVSPVFSVSLGGTIRVITFITPQIATAFQQAAARINAQLNSQTFATDQGIVPPPVTQNLLYEVASGGPGSGPASTQLLNVLTADPVAIGSATISAARSFSRSSRGIGMSAGPVPRIRKSMPSASRNTGSRLSAVMAGSFQACMPVGRQSSEPRCDMPRKWKPPLP